VRHYATLERRLFEMFYNGSVSGVAADSFAMSLFGLAALPSDDISHRIVSFRKFVEERRLVSGPSLGVNINIPHLTILQSPFKESDLTPSLLEEIVFNAGLEGNGLRGRFMGLYEQTRGWCFMGVDCSSWGVALQDASLNLLKDSVIREAISWDGSEDLWKNSERENQMLWGYRYLGEDFIPHITLGRFDGIDGSVPSGKLLELFESEFGGIGFEFSRLVFYRAGEFGVLNSVLAEIELPFSGKK
jgi:hypothetical protein